MKNFIMAHEPAIRFLFFFGMLIIMAVWEVFAPRRFLRTRKNIRWYSNLGLVAIDTLALRLLLPLQAVGVALYVEAHGWGIFNIVLLPEWMSIVLGVFFLDFVIYLQHAMFHFIPAFWRLHRVQHRSRFRCHHRNPFSSRRNPSIHGHKNGSGRFFWSLCHRRGHFRGAPQRHQHVQPW